MTCSIQFFSLAEDARRSHVEVCSFLRFALNDEVFRGLILACQKAVRKKVEVSVTFRDAARYVEVAGVLLGRILILLARAQEEPLPLSTKLRRWSQLLALSLSHGVQLSLCSLFYNAVKLDVPLSV